MTRRLVVLLSGTGSNAAALLDFLDQQPDVGTVVALGADRDAPGLHLATERSIPTFVVAPADFHDRGEWGEALATEIERFAPDLVILSGFMRLLPPAVVDRFAPRIINTHPAYLPEFPGAHGVGDALAAGVSQTGASVIVVDHGVDTGPIVAQERVPILPGDSEETLHERIKTVERRLLADVLTRLHTGDVTLPS